MKNEIHPVKETLLLLWLIPLGGLLRLLDRSADDCVKWYKRYHAAGCYIANYIERTMKKNNHK